MMTFVEIILNGEIKGNIDEAATYLLLTAAHEALASVLARPSWTPNTSQQILNIAHALEIAARGE